ncbi:MAG TPA: M48 family metallopeptidase [Candidatus Marinimicrobia bacterium]|nr:peptidase M48 [Candidatus Neomarinimicrobiota bacterium]MDP6143482.1 M48 family metallopeptidase [Candidatus Neomarinimicrobiota bacterium]MDP6261914.1 M48 family metallopeptidase [Candidatus Neomarinimicrobiota bacterium]MDP7128059.1 M48 family metallopeptidase [Candidatus Neomarinimicrobiota bacterium]MDP7337256.1 M48 family metallopeptidase [Candidatus Neomarinimicrobiota bacterium]
MNIYLLIILSALIGEFLLRTLVRVLNLKALDPGLPNEFQGYYDEEKYARSQEYTRVNARFAFFTTSFDFIIILVFILFGGFNFVDQIVRGFGLSTLPSGLAFFGILFFASDLISTPFSLYQNFVIEEDFGFNKMTLKTFILDKLKGYLLTLVLGGVFLTAILFFFEETGEYGWLYAWGIIGLFMILIQPLFTLVIAPMFNKFTPLEKGELRTAIENYAQKVGFPLSRIDVMDGSKRSAKSNAYFSGFGKQKRIALFDTLLEKHSNDEMVAILAHEVGHYKKHHIKVGILISILHTGLLFWLLSIFIDNPGLFEAFQMKEISVYGGLTFFMILYSPVELVLSVIMNAVSRKNEFQADAYSAKTTEKSEHLISGLKNLSVSNLGNLTPHSLSVLLDHSHPPVLERITALKKI